jgi:hypothetical protein
MSVAGHGMRSQLTAPALAPSRPPPPPEPRTVVNLADFDQGGDFAEPLEVEPEVTGPPDEDMAEPEEAAGAASEGPPSGAAPVPDPLREVPMLGDVTIIEHGGGIVVAVTIGDMVAERSAIASESGVDQALLAVVCDLLGIAPVPTLVSVAAIEQDGSRIMSVLVDDGLVRRAGSAVSRGNRAWAVARALWSALSGPA